MHKPWASNVLFSNQKRISKAKGRNRFGTEKKTTDVKFEYSKEEKKLEN
jgi:hypothetical protein